jgi:hypothetical protein
MKGIEKEAIKSKGVVWGVGRVILVCPESFLR